MSRGDFWCWFTSPSPARSGDLNKLVFVVKEGKRFVTSMQLPEFGMGLDFVMPDKPIIVVRHPGADFVEFARGEPE